MTYEEKLEKIVSKLKEERDLTRKGRSTKVVFDDSSFTKIRIGDICKILLQLQDDKGAVKIFDALQPEETVPTEQIISPSDDDDHEGVDVVIAELDEAFDEWYSKYLVSQKSTLTELNYINLLRILEAMVSIREKIQLKQTATVIIPILPQRIHFRELMLADDAGQRDEFIQGRWDSLGYLKKENIIKDFRLIDSMMHRWDDSAEVTINANVFYSFYEKVKQEVTRRLEDKEQRDAVEKNENQKTTPLETEQQKISIKVAYDPKKGELNIEGKKVKFKKDSFRAKLIELLLKDNKSIKKEWSWDEVIGEIEDTKDEESNKENKKKFYPACDGLTKHIASKTGVNDLLIFNKSTVQINPKYL